MTDTALAAPAAQLREVLRRAGRGLVEREALVEAVALAAVAGEHVLVIGPPGTAKSEAVRRIAQGLGERYFEYLVGRFTEPSEIFGPVDLRKLREGVVETATAGMLPEAQFAFLDEVFLGSTAILNTLLGILNERVFRRGHTQVRCPLRVCVGAANTLPDDPALAAFADRFLVRVFVEPLPDPRLEELLESGWALAAPSGAVEGASPLETLAAAVSTVELAPVRSRLAQGIRLLRQGGIVFTDRRAVKAQRLVAAAAVLDGRLQATEADLWPLVHAVPTAEGQRIAREQLRELLAPTESASLPAAASEASAGPLARAVRLAEAAEQLLAAPAEGAALEAWRLKLEGIAREIDAGFTAQSLPARLAEVRSRVVAHLRPRPEANAS